VHNYDAQQHRAGQIISPLAFQTIIIAQMSVEGEGEGGPVIIVVVVYMCYSRESSGRHSHISVIAIRPSVRPSVCLIQGRSSRAVVHPLLLLVVSSSSSSCSSNNNNNTNNNNNINKVLP